MLYGILPGTATLTLTIRGTSISKAVNVTVGNIVETVGKVYASIDSGTTVEVGTTVELFTNTFGAEIYYTTDRTCPCITDSPSRILYTGPITINEDVYIVAYAVSEDKSENRQCHTIHALKRLKRRYCKHFKHIFRSIMFDNGSVFADANGMGKPGVIIYFAHPYSAWERGQK